MLVYTPESKTQLHHVLQECHNWGIYSKRFVTELHRKLSILHLRDDTINVTYVEFKATPEHKNKTVTFSCELSLKWDHGTVGGMVWNESDKTFGIHT